MTWKTINWDHLRALREKFLTSPSKSAVENYWNDRSTLQDYHLTFAQRIGWKWQAVLREAQSLGWAPPTQKIGLIDWGCGTGIATLTFMQFWQKDFSPDIRLWDRSLPAMDFAHNQLQQLSNQWIIEKGSPEKTLDSPFILLISHVLEELSPKVLARLLAIAHQAHTIFWVEPGQKATSHKLISIREKLTSHFRVLAPCPHHQSCGLLVEKNQHHWCHHFAEVPASTFQDSNWKRFSTEMGIDLRSLPVSFLILEKNEVNQDSTSHHHDLSRLIGRARHYKGYCSLTVCNNTGVEEAKLLKREQPGYYKKLKKNQFTTHLPNAALRFTQETP